MKTTSRFFALALASSLVLGTWDARADLGVSASVNIHATAEFEAPLAAHGDWIAVHGYGRCWHPDHVALGWRPYCYGHWEWTDCGWYWASDEPWAWACYHYGYWVYDPVYFWVWIPGVEWGPAWVSWRVGGGYIGWAPLPPPHVSLRVVEPQFVFVESKRFQDQLRPSAVLVNNTTIIKKTTVINSVRYETRDLGGPAPQKVVFNQGPRLENVQKVTGRTFGPVPIREAIRRTPAPSLNPGRALEPGPRDKSPLVSPDSGKPPTSFGQPGGPFRNPGDPGEGKGHGREGEGHGRDKF